MLILLALLVVLAGCQIGPPPEQIVNEAGYNEITTASIRLQWRIDGSSLEVILSAPTAGWVAVGFDPTSRMKDANIIITKVVSGVAEARDDYGDTTTSHRSDASAGGLDNVTGVTGSESGGTTEVSFTIPLDSGDLFDRPLVDGQQYTVLLAYASTEDFAAQHTVRAKVTVTL